MSLHKTPWYSRFLARSPEGRNEAPAASGAPDVIDVYESAPPSYQNAINLLPGWNHAFPAAMQLAAGEAHMHEDPRIYFAAAAIRLA